MSFTYQFSNEPIGSKVLLSYNTPPLKGYDELNTNNHIYYDYNYGDLCLIYNEIIVMRFPTQIIFVKWAIACSEKVLSFYKNMKPYENKPFYAIENSKNWLVTKKFDNFKVDDGYYNGNYYYYNFFNFHHDQVDESGYQAYHAAMFTSMAASSSKKYVNWSIAAAIRSRFSVGYNNGTKVCENRRKEGIWQENKLKEIISPYIQQYIQQYINLLTIIIIPELSQIIVNYMFVY